MNDAFAIRGRVIVGMCVLAGLIFVGTAWMGLKVWRWVNG
jgi:hypothetical protein